MKQLIKYSLQLIAFLVITTLYASGNDAYLVFYATHEGKSGHVGIAVDNYKVIVKDIVDGNNKQTRVYDTIADGSLTYYDLWPQTDDFNMGNLDKDLPAKYYKLPRASWEQKITVNMLLEEGIPHEEHYPVDGLLRITSSYKQDQKLKKFAEQLIDTNRAFNVRAFNCSDFVELILESHCKCSIDADEFIVFKKSTTPNRLYQETLKLTYVTIIKDAKEKAQGSFTMERLVKRENNE